MKFSKTAFIKAGAAVVILGCGIAAMQLLASSKAEANKRDIEPPVRKVETLVPSFGDMAYEVEGNGLVESAGSIRLYAAVPGRVTFSHKGLNEGIYVEKDELLLSIDSRQAGNNLNLARSELVKAVASLVPQFKSGGSELYGKWNRYLASLDFNEDETPELPSVSDSREKLLISTYGIYGAYYNVKNAEIILEQHSLYAPISGYISGQGVPVDSYIGSGQSLLTIIDARNLKISVPLTVDELDRIDSDTFPSVEILSPRDNRRALKGRLVARDMELERTSQMVNVHIEFENPGLDPQFAPGNFVDIRIEGRILKDTAVIPRFAIVDNRYVYTYEEGKLGRRDVSVIAVSEESAYIGNNLPEGTEIVTTILQKPLIGMSLSNINEGKEPEVASAAEVIDNEKDS